MITDDTKRILISQITINREHRQRRAIETEDLEKSIARVGLLSPIIIDRQFELKAGERRLTACKNLGHSDILVRFVENLSDVDAQIIELEENLKRSDLEWKDQLNAVARIHSLYLEKDPDWTMTETSVEISMSLGTVSMYLRTAAELTTNERVAQASTIREAYNIITRRDARAAGDALEDLISTPDAPRALIGGPTDTWLGSTSPAIYISQPDIEKPHVETESIFNESFLDWAPHYTGKKFNLIHCDFPYGVNLNAGEQGLGSEPSSGYKDTSDTYFDLLECLCLNLDRLMSVSGHLLFWYSEKHGFATRQMFSKLAPSLEFQTFPLVWVKSDNAGIASDAKHNPRHVYETCLMATRGKRQIVRIVADAYQAPTDKTLHMSTKPEPMLKHFMTMLVDESTSLLDPTCGSGAALRAAEGLGASRTVGLEIDKEFCTVAQKALRNHRLLRAASS